MAYVVADFTAVKDRLISLLGANPGVWTSTVSGFVGAFPSNSEIQQACLEADSIVAVQGYAQSANDSLANPFQVTTAPSASRDPVPFHHGELSKVEVAQSTQNFTTISLSNVIPLTAHGLTTGQLVSFITTGVLPTGLSLLTNYYVIRLTVDTISVATSLQNALAGIAVTISISTGSGIHTIIAWQVGVEARNMDEITNATNGVAAYVGGGTDDGSYDFLYKPADGLLYTLATYWRATYFEYTQTSDLQCNQNETWLIVFTAAAILAKNASPALFALYDGYSQRGLSQLKIDGMYAVQTNELPN
jgi:hypothetical protein